MKFFHQFLQPLEPARLYDQSRDGRGVAWTVVPCATRNMVLGRPCSVCSLPQRASPDQAGGAPISHSAFKGIEFLDITRCDDLRVSTHPFRLAG